MDPSLSEFALARWLADGLTSQTHPVLRYALRTYLNPIGIGADCLEAEPFGDLENGGGGWWLHGANWYPELFDPGHSARPDFFPLLNHTDQFQLRVGRRGLLTISLASLDKPGGFARAWYEQSEAGWTVTRHCVRAAEAMEAFIYAAAVSLLAKTEAANLYAAGKFDAFCTSIENYLDDRSEPAAAPAP